MLMPFAAYASTGENKLRELLGQMPERKPLQIDTLESVKLEDGIRYKIRIWWGVSQKKQRNWEDYIKIQIK